MAQAVIVVMFLMVASAAGASIRIAGGLDTSYVPSPVHALRLPPMSLTAAQEGRCPENPGWNVMPNVAETVFPAALADEVIPFNRH
jgi:hypothetical protein